MEGGAERTTRARVTSYCYKIAQECRIVCRRGSPRATVCVSERARVREGKRQCVSLYSCKLHYMCLMRAHTQFIRNNNLRAHGQSKLHIVQSDFSLAGLCQTDLPSSSSSTTIISPTHRRSSNSNLPPPHGGKPTTMASLTTIAPKREKDPKKRVVITGMGIVSVFGNDVDTYYEKLLEGQSGVGYIEKFDTSNFPTKIGGEIKTFSTEGYIDGKNDRRLDDVIRYCLVSGKKALENANLGLKELDKLDKQRIGVLVGSGMGGSRATSDAMDTLIEKGYKKISPFYIPYAIPNAGSAFLAIDMGVMGPIYSISAACATSNACIYAAANHIREGEADMMVAGGSEAPIHPVGLGGFAACKALSQRNHDPVAASRPWDVHRDGFVMGEGAGALVMESLEHAIKREAPILAEYLGGSITCDAYHITNPRDDGLGVCSCIEKTLEDARVSIEEVNYINAHATSTRIGDVAEIHAIKKIFKNHNEIKINSTKSMIGHCLGSSGALEAIATIKAIGVGWVHPTINQHMIEPCVEFDTIANKKQQHEIHVAISNSFGFGGHNCVVAFAPFNP